jgi:hypothetical protein
MKKTKRTEGVTGIRRKKIVSDRIRTCAGKLNSFLSCLLNHSDTLNYVRKIVVTNEEKMKRKQRSKEGKKIMDSDRIRTCTGKPKSFLSCRCLPNHSDTLNCDKKMVVINEGNRRSGNREARKQKKTIDSDRIRTCAGKPNSFLSCLLNHSDTLNCIGKIVVSFQSMKKTERTERTEREKQVTK